ncbi:class I SAM-dependent methyltransferase [Xanthovirga aplysinae]|uniref:class I SAM-dependent methyltransferase n=1 Tax=Xanthovirga aplysinae TaxID=2529853 RepID=UPI0012BCB9B9|nr:class I SAM-dependent methyltransferase [Xanthovirga aplysinae]MTI30131.1 class I SAM-dependent methyltransferase [Xanthovirga aplysinae]
MATFTTEIASDQIASDNPVHQRLLKAYYEAQPYIQGELLEIGCGEGRGVELLAPKSESYLALDKISEVIDRLRQKYPHVNFQQAFVPPFKGIADNSFDVIVSFQVIEHIEDDKYFLQEIQRVLKPGGKAIITTPNIKQTLTRNPWHEREYTAQELNTLCSPIFSKVDMKGIAGSARMMEYHEKNRESVRKITRFDIFNLQYRLPAPILRVPYDILNRLNRNRLKKSNDNLVSNINLNDFHLTTNMEECLDLFFVLYK